MNDSSLQLKALKSAVAHIQDNITVLMVSFTDLQILIIFDSRFKSCSMTLI